MGRPSSKQIDVDSALQTVIDEHRLAGRERLENEVDLSARLGVSRNTLREALARAALNGQVVRKRRVGTLIVNGEESDSGTSERRERLQYPLDRVVPVPDFLRSANQEFTIQSVAVSRSRVGTTDAARLQISAGSDIFVVKRKYEIVNQIVFVSKHVIPAVLEGRSTHIDALTDGVVNFLSEVENVRVDRVEHIVDAIGADSVLAHDFGIAVGTPLLKVVATLFASNAPKQRGSKPVALGDLVFSPAYFSGRAEAS